MVGFEGYWVIFKQSYSMGQYCDLGDSEILFSHCSGQKHIETNDNTVNSNF